MSDDSTVGDACMTQSFLCLISLQLVHIRSLFNQYVELMRNHEFYVFLLTGIRVDRQH